MLPDLICLECFEALATHLSFRVAARQVALSPAAFSDRIKRLEEERREIDAELQGAYSDAELRWGVQFGGGWILKQCQRTSWIYDQQTRHAIKAIQQEAQRSGSAIAQTSTYLQASCIRH